MRQAAKISMLRGLQKAMLYVFREYTARLLLLGSSLEAAANRGIHVLVQTNSVTFQVLMLDSCEDGLSQCSYAHSEMQGSSSQCVVP